MSAAGPGAYSAPYGPESPANVFWTDFVNGGKNPQWRYQIAMGMNATTSMTAQRATVEVVRGHLEARGCTHSDRRPSSRLASGQKGLCGLVLTLPSRTGIEQGKADNAAAADYYKKLARRVSELKAQVVTGESREAVRMMKDRSKRVIQSVAQYNSRLKKSANWRLEKKHRLKYLSDNYLELQFGWLPLFSDIEDAHHILQNPGRQFRFVKGEGNHNVVESTTYSTVSSSPLFFQKSSVQTTRYYVKYYGIVRVSSSPVPSLRRDAGLTLREFVPTLWEILPWSFLVDYFTNVGEVINAASYYGFSGSTVTRTSVEERTVTRTAFGASNGCPYEKKTVSSPASVVASVANIARLPNVNVPMPTLQFQIPGRKQALNMLALAVSRRFRFFP